MARKDLTQVKREAFIAVAEKLGMAVVERKGWTKLFRMGEDGKPAGKAALGVPTTKLVTRVELVNFEHELGVEHPKPPAGSVKQMMDFTKADKDIIRDFYRIAREGVLGGKATRQEEREATREAAEANSEQEQEQAPAH